MVNFAPISQTAAAANDTQSQAANQNAALGKDTFLQLLVAQIRNQNPLNPADGVEFLSQLAQFSQLEQSMGIKEEISALRGQVDAITAAITKTQKTEGAGNV